MNELKRLKKDWKENQKFPKISKKEIYGLLHKKSASVVKWIFIISIIEFSFWTLLSLIFKDNEAQRRFEQYEMDHITMPLIIFGYVALIYFFILFYGNYKSISTTVNSKELMEKILKTRKTVKYYVIFNLLFLCISIIIGIYIELNNSPDINLITSGFTKKEDYYIWYLIIIVITILAIVCITALFILWYYLLYGLMLKKLKKNYKYLKKIESNSD